MNAGRHAGRTGARRIVGWLRRRRIRGRRRRPCVVAASAQVTVPVPLSPVPMTLQPLAVLAVGGLLGAALGGCGAAALPRLGLLGLPVFAGGSGGLAARARADRRLPAGLSSGRRGGGRVSRVDARSLVRVLLGCALAMVVIHAGGVAQLALLGGDAGAALRVGFVPFLTGDLLKVGLAAAVILGLGPKLRTSPLTGPLVGRPVRPSEGDRMVDRLRRTGPRPHRPHRLRPRAAGHRLGGSGVGLARRQPARVRPAPGARHAAELRRLHLAHRRAGARTVARGPSLDRESHGVPGLRTGLGRGRRGRRHRLAIAAVVGGGRVVTRHGNGGRLRRHASRARSLVLAPAALAEEVMFRGRPARARWRAAFGRGTAIVLVAGRASRWSHLANPNVTALATRQHRARRGLPRLAFYAPGGIWTAFGAHLGWNGALAALDAPVSGAALPHPAHRLPTRATRPGSPAARFGPEGGLARHRSRSPSRSLVARRWAGKEPA